MIGQIFSSDLGRAFETEKVILRDHDVPESYDVDEESSALILYTAPSGDNPNSPGLYVARKDGYFEIALKKEEIQEFPKCPNPEIVHPHPRAPNSMLMYKDRVYLWLTNPDSCVPWMTGSISQRPDYSNLYPNITSSGDTSCQSVHKTDKGEFLWRCKLDLLNAVAKNGTCHNLGDELFLGEWLTGFIQSPSRGDYHLLHRIFPVGTPIEVDKFHIYNYGANYLSVFNSTHGVATMKLLSGQILHPEWYENYRLTFLERNELRKIWAEFVSRKETDKYDPDSFFYNYMIHRSSEKLLKDMDFSDSLDLGRETKIGQNFQVWLNDSDQEDYPECYYEYEPEYLLVCEDGDPAKLPPKRHAIKGTDPREYHEEGYGKRVDGRSYIYVPVLSRAKSIHDCDPN